MDTIEIRNYILKSKAAGKSHKEIVSNLKSAGWSDEDIQSALNSTEDIPVPKPNHSIDNIASSHSHSITMWDAFENILLFISLYVMATSIGIILHSFVDKWVSGPYSEFGSSYSFYSEDLLKGAVAALIVSAPLYSFFFLRIIHSTIKNPMLKQLKTRKFMQYLTLVITFILMLINVIKIVFSYLDGNLILNTLLHFLVTIGISTVIFMYYLHITKEDRRKNV